MKRIRGTSAGTPWCSRLDPCFLDSSIYFFQHAGKSMLIKPEGHQPNTQQITSLRRSAFPAPVGKAVCSSGGLAGQGFTRMSHILDELKALHAASQEERARLAQVTADASRLRAENTVLNQKCQSLVWEANDRRNELAA